MTVFKTFWQVVKRYKGTIIGFTIMLVIFGTINMSSNDVTSTFKESKPDIIIVNNDNTTLSNDLVSYFKETANIIDVKNTERAIDDAIFYRDASYVIYIPDGYEESILNGGNGNIEIKSSGDYTSNLAEMLLTRYIKTIKVLSKEYSDKTTLLSKVNSVLDENSKVELTTKINTTELTRLSRYYNFASYTLIAVILFIICLVLSSFNKENTRKRIIVSSMDYKKHNKYILIASSLYSLFVVILYTILAFIIFGSLTFSERGLLYILNTFIFSFVALCMALFISTLVKSKEAVSGIVNVVALSQAFLCGAFIPTMWLPESVIKIAHLLPAYWYINTNDFLAELEVLSFTNLKPIWINMLILIGFAVIFIILNNIASRKKMVS